MPLTKFHSYHGENIVLYDENMVAYRKGSFAHAITFSEKPLSPNEIFLLEIERNERGWAGHIRLGVTQSDPGTQFPLPKYTQSEQYSNAGNSWIFSVPNNLRDMLTVQPVNGVQAIREEYGPRSPCCHVSGITNGEEIEETEPRAGGSQDCNSNHLYSDSTDGRTPNRADSTGGGPLTRVDEHRGECGDEMRPNNGDEAEWGLRAQLPVPVTVNRHRHNCTHHHHHHHGHRGHQQPPMDQLIVERPSLLSPSSTQKKKKTGVLPTDVGSRIGVMYVINDRKANSAELHFILNGEDQGVYGQADIPYKRAPLFAVADIYGTTKQVRIVQLYGVASLQSGCRVVIVAALPSPQSQIARLPLPQKMKDYLLYCRQ